MAGGGARGPSGVGVPPNVGVILEVVRVVEIVDTMDSEDGIVRPGDNKCV